MEKRISVRDIAFILALLLIGLVSWLILGYMRTQQGNVAVIIIDSEVYGEYGLDRDQVIPIEKDGAVINTLEISSGKASMIDATCKDKLCVHQRAISSVNETIVCLPHKLVVTVKDSKADSESEFDAVAR